MKRVYEGGCMGYVHDFIIRKVNSAFIPTAPRQAYPLVPPPRRFDIEHNTECTKIRKIDN
jgi:hypothetical protein